MISRRRTSSRAGRENSRAARCPESARKEETTDDTDSTDEKQRACGSPDALRVKASPPASYPCYPCHPWFFFFRRSSDLSCPAALPAVSASLPFPLGVFHE